MDSPGTPTGKAEKQGRSRSSATPRRGRRIGALPLAVILAPLALSLRPTAPARTIGPMSPAHCSRSSPLGADASWRSSSQFTFSPTPRFPAPSHLPSRMRLLPMRGGEDASEGRSPSPLPSPSSRGPSPARASSSPLLRSAPPSWPHPSSGNHKKNEPIRTSDWMAGAHVGGYSVTIDVRTPAEWEEDHVPGSINLPVLSHEQRHEVGLLHKASAFEGRKLGASLISRNIGDIVEREFMDKPREYKPLVYCWRGGQRSGSLATVLAAIGYRVSILEGGYKGYRATVGAALLNLPSTFEWRVLTGPTGSGKTKILIHFEAQEHQVLDLEGLANHRGSVLGSRKEGQPSQKLFESRVAAKLSAFDPSRPVWVEDEASLVGNLHVPPEVFDAMKTAVRYNVILPVDERVRWTLEEYAELTRQPEHLKALLSKLVKHQGHKVIGEWHATIDAGDYAGLVKSLLELHYDPANSRSIRERRAKYNPEVLDLPLSALDPATLNSEIPASIFALTPGGPRLPTREANAPSLPCEPDCRCGKCRRKARAAELSAEKELLAQPLSGE